MQQHPLIGLGKIENVTHVLGRPPQDIAQPDHLGLDGRKSVDRLTDDADVSGASSRSSGRPRQSFGNVDHPPGHLSPAPWNHDSGTVRPASG